MEPGYEVGITAIHRGLRETYPVNKSLNIVASEDNFCNFMSVMDNEKRTLRKNKVDTISSEHSEGI